jgi:hypothetical protein
LCEAGRGLFLGTNVECADVVDCIPLLVTFESMSATGGPQGVAISWTTASEVDTVGFRVLRQMSDGRTKALAQVGPMVFGSGDSFAGASYEVFDNTPEASRARFYILEDIDIYGKVTQHGPISVERAPTVRETPVSRVKR